VASYDNLGDVHAARASATKGDIAAKERAEALRFYERSLEMMRQLVANSPANGNWQYDLAVSFNKLGGLYFDRNEFSPAAAQYQEGLATAEKLIARDPSLPKWQALRAFFIGNLGRTALRTGDFAAARAKLTEAKSILSKLVEQKKLGAEQAGWLSDFEADFASLPPG
jgi:tetratricopeptide (TPR) repeat protein